MFRAEKGLIGAYFFRLSADAIAIPPKASSISANEYSQLYGNRNQAPPRTIKPKPMAIVLKELRSYFWGLAPRIAANANIQMPKRARTSGGNSVHLMRFVATMSIATTRIMQKTPMVNIWRLLSDIHGPSYNIVAPHSGQNFELAGIECPHLGQFIVACDGGVRLVPHSGQNFEVAGTCAPHFGQITRAAVGA